MTPAQQMHTASSDWQLGACLKAMQGGGFRHLPILDGERPLGVLSMRDVSRAISSEVSEMSVATSDRAAAAPLEDAIKVPASDLCAARATRVHLGALAKPECVEVKHRASVADAVLLMRNWKAG